MLARRAGAGAASGDDLDGDGTSNRDEFLAGTDARSAQSVFVVSAVQPAAGELSISWRSEAGLHYRVLAATQLAGPYTPIATGIAATPPVNVLPLGASAAQQRFVIICTER